ncbi:MAG: aminoglycoside phosphotransferase family protein [Sphingomonadales bacterium]|nr:aminoglycoside phosphotransferase family protein [Sphingomonadales bacterium]
MGDSASVPKTVDEALSPAWLSVALGRPVVAVEQVEFIRTVATKIRFKVTHADGSTRALCIKGLLDADEMTAKGGSTMVREADFYGEIAGHVDVRVPTLAVNVIDRQGSQAVVLMNDLIAEGATFCSALDPFTAQECAASLDQLARLHAGRALLATRPWITRRVSELANSGYVTADGLQQLLDGKRGDPLPAAVRDGARLIAAVKALDARDRERPQFLVHGDAHAGNIFRFGAGHAKAGPGLIDWQLLQSGGWALDVAYHIAAVLPVATAEREERALLAHYLETMRGLGVEMPDAEAAWAQYREAPAYGYYLWGITRRVDPPIIETFVPRLGLAVARHDSFALLGV